MDNLWSPMDNLWTPMDNLWTPMDDLWTPTDDRWSARNDAEPGAAVSLVSGNLTSRSMSPAVAGSQPADST